VVENLKIEGNRAGVGGHSWLHSAVTFWNVERSAIRDLWVHESSFEGISDQAFDKPTHNFIVDNRITGSRGNGIHLGTWYSHAVVERNTISGSGGDGLFFCLGITSNLIAGNRITGSARSAIGGIDCCYDGIVENGDHFNVIVGNVLERSGAHGVSVAGGRHNVISENQITDNSECGVYSYNGVGNLFARNTLARNKCAFDDRIVDVPEGNRYSGNITN
jgi:parallel beta-helix repeat protein